MKRPALPRRRRTALGFIKETVAELRKVVWPSRQEAVRLTILVIIISGVVGLALGALDLGFTEITKFILPGAK